MPSCVVLIQEQPDHDAHADCFHGADGSWDCFVGKPLFYLHQEGSSSAFVFIFLINVFCFLILLFSAQIAGFVNAKVTDESIQQVSLDILESMVQSSHGLFVQVKQEVTMERLIAHLQV